MDLVITSAAPQAAASLPGDAAAPGAPPSSQFVDLLAALIAGQTAAAGCEYRPQGGAEVACDGKVPQGDPRLGEFFDFETGLPKTAGPRGWTAENEAPLDADGAAGEDEDEADVTAAVVTAVPVAAPMTQVDVEAIEIAAAAPNAVGSTDAAAAKGAAGAPAPVPASAGPAAPATSFTNLFADAQIGAESLETAPAVTTAPIETPAASGEETNAAHATAARALARTLAQFAPDANATTQPQAQTAAASGQPSAPASVPESNAAVSSDAAAQAAAASSSPARRPETIESREFAPSLPDATDPGIALRGVTPAAGPQSVGDRPAASAPRLETVEISNPPDADADVATQIVRSIKTSLKDGIGEARVRLRPDYLGEVRIELKVEGDRVSAVLQVERADVRQQVEQGSQSLRSTLAAQGLHLEELTVREDGGSRQDRREGERREGSRRQARRPSTGEVFELPE